MLGVEFVSIDRGLAHSESHPDSIACIRDATVVKRAWNAASSSVPATTP